MTSLLPIVLIVSFSLGILLWKFTHLTAFPTLAGPKPQSFLWGCEWDLHTSKPGVRYLQWHSEFGNAYKLPGAFGVCLLFHI